MAAFLSCNKKQIDNNNNAEEEISGLALNEWKFSVGNKDYRGNIKISYFSPGIGLTLEAAAGPLQDTSVLFLVGFPGNQINKSVFGTTSTLPCNSLLYMSNPNTVGIFDANPNTSNYGSVTFQIIYYDSVSRQVKGKFFGKAIDKDYNPTTITNGAFWAVVQ